MYNTQKIAKRIKDVSKSKNEPLGTMLSKLEMGINTISELSKGKQISYLNFAKIADYLNVSVDYLLCRTDNPKSCNGDCITIGDIDGNYNMTVGKDETKPLKIDGLSKQMLEKFECLDFDKKVEVMTLISNLSKK